MNEFGFLPNTLSQNKLKIHQRPYHRPKMKNLLEENTQEKLHDIGFGNNVLDMTPKVHATKDKIDKLYFTEIKNFYTLKDTINRVKKEPTE